MIIATSLEHAHHYGDIIPSIYRLRYQAFISRQSYEVPTYKDMEYDAYDTPATVYLAWRDEYNIVRGCTRLSPTDRPYMIKDVWPQSVQNIPLPTSSDIWEASRFCIDKTMPIHLRKRIHGELLCAFQEYCLTHNIQWMIGVMTNPIWHRVFIQNGWPVEYLGDPLVLDARQSIITGKMPISENILQCLKDRFNIEESVLPIDNVNNLQQVA